MDWIVWAGAALSLAGLVGIMWSIWAVKRARQADLTDEALKDRIQRILPVNIAALMGSVLGLGMITIGLILS